MKKLMLTAGFLLVSMNLHAQATDPAQLFVGEKTPTNSCGTYGRLATASELSQMRNLCDHVSSPWGIWKIEGDNGSLWSFMGSGSGYNCQVKAGVNPSAPSICTTKENADTNTAYLFSGIEYKGSHAWDGRPLVATMGDQNPQATIHSFKLGEGIKLVGFSEEGYSGEEFIYTSSQSNLAYPIKSYKLESEVSEKLVTFSYSSNSIYKTCIKILAPGQGLQSLCSDEEYKTLPLITMPEQAITLNVAVYEERYENPQVPVSTVGQLFLNFDGEGDFTINNVALQPEVNALKQENNILFSSN